MSRRKPVPIRLLPRELRTRRVADIMLMRSIIGFLGSWENCFAACRRHKRCASPTVACFDHNLDMIRDRLADFADWPRLEGPRDPDELDQPVSELLD